MIIDRINLLLSSINSHVFNNRLSNDQVSLISHLNKLHLFIRNVDNSDKHILVELKEEDINSFDLVLHIKEYYIANFPPYVENNIPDVFNNEDSQTEENQAIVEESKSEEND